MQGYQYSVSIHVRVLKIYLLKQGESTEIMYLLLILIVGTDSNLVRRVYKICLSLCMPPCAKEK